MRFSLRETTQVTTRQSGSNFVSPAFDVSDVALGLSGFFVVAFSNRPSPDTVRARSRRDTLIVRTFKMSLCISMNAMCLVPKVRVASPAASSTLVRFFAIRRKLDVASRRATPPLREPIGRARTTSTRRYARETPSRRYFLRCLSGAARFVARGRSRRALSRASGALVRCPKRVRSSLIRKEAWNFPSSPCRKHPLTPPRPRVSLFLHDRRPVCPRARLPP